MRNRKCTFPSPHPQPRGDPGERGPGLKRPLCGWDVLEGKQGAKNLSPRHPCSQTSDSGRSCWAPLRLCPLVSKMRLAVHPFHRAAVRTKCAKMEEGSALLWLPGPWVPSCGAEHPGSNSIPGDCQRRPQDPARELAEIAGVWGIDDGQSSVLGPQANSASLAG